MAESEKSDAAAKESVVDKELLQAFRFFNRNWVGYITFEWVLLSLVKIHDLEKVLEPLFYNWRCKRQQGESFGDFTTRLGFDKLKETVEKWEGIAKAPAQDCSTAGHGSHPQLCCRLAKWQK